MAPTIDCRFVANSVIIWSVTLPMTPLPIAATLPERAISALTVPCVAPSTSTSVNVADPCAVPWPRISCAFPSNTAR